MDSPSPATGITPFVRIPPHLGDTLGLLAHLIILALMAWGWAMWQDVQDLLCITYGPLEDWLYNHDPHGLLLPGYGLVGIVAYSFRGNFFRTHRRSLLRTWAVGVIVLLLAYAAMAIAPLLVIG